MDDVDVDVDVLAQAEHLCQLLKLLLRMRVIELIVRVRVMF